METLSGLELDPDCLIQADLCIIGAGPAGQAVASQFAGSKWNVVLLESGGLAYDPELEKLNRGEVIGARFNLFDKTRVRQYGGTANKWAIDLMDRQDGVRLAPLDPIDFESREWVAHSGWPFGMEELLPYYESAQELFESGPFKYKGSDWDCPSLLDGGDLQTNVFQFGHGRPFLSPGSGRDWIRLVHHAVARDFELKPDGRTVDFLRVRNPAGVEFRIKSRYFVLAAGAIENARLMLNSDHQHPGGLGNHHDVLGRYFMEHPQFSPGLLIPARRDIFDQTGFYDLRLQKGSVVMGTIQLPEAVQRKHRLLNATTLLFPRHKSFDPLALQSLVHLYYGLKYRYRPDGISRHLGQLWRGRSYLFWLAHHTRLGTPEHQRLFDTEWGHGGWSVPPDPGGRYGCFELVQLTEQAPHAENRIVLGPDSDPHGMRTVQIHWKWGRQEQESVRKTQALLKKAFEERGIGELKEFPVSGNSHRGITSSHHPMGGTRMHADPRFGVVDGNSLVHGLDNLFVTGSSVFPTGGYVNPTLTLAALAIRLGRRIRSLGC